MNEKVLFLVRNRNYVYICDAEGREDAKRQARPFLLGDPDQYVVEPLTGQSDRVRINVGWGASPLEEF